MHRMMISWMRLLPYKMMLLHLRIYKTNTLTYKNQDVWACKKCMPNMDPKMFQNSIKRLENGDLAVWSVVRLKTGFLMYSVGIQWSHKNFMLVILDYIYLWSVIFLLSRFKKLAKICGCIKFRPRFYICFCFFLIVQDCL